MLSMECVTSGRVRVGTAGHFQRACCPLNNVPTGSLSLAGILHFKNVFGSRQVWGEGERSSVSLGQAVWLWHCSAGTCPSASGARLLGSDIKMPFRWGHCATVRAETPALWPAVWERGGQRAAHTLAPSPRPPVLPPSQNKRGNKREQRGREQDHRIEGSGTSLWLCLKPLPAPWSAAGKPGLDPSIVPLVLRGPRQWPVALKRSSLVSARDAVLAAGQAWPGSGCCTLWTGRGTRARAHLLPTDEQAGARGAGQVPHSVCLVQTSGRGGGRRLVLGGPGSGRPESPPSLGGLLASRCPKRPFCDGRTHFLRRLSTPRLFKAPLFGENNNNKLLVQLQLEALSPW